MASNNNNLGAVIVYSQPGCTPCDAVKEFLASHGVDFVVKDIRQDEAALHELIELGATSTPTIVVGEDVIIGFDQDRLRQVLNLS